MGFSDADPTAGQDSPEVADLKRRLAEAESRQSAPAPTEDSNPEVERLQRELEQSQAQVDELTQKVLTADQSDPNVDIKDLLNQLVTAQSEQRAEMAQLRAEVARSRRTPIPTSSVALPTAEELHAARQRELEQHDYYCPACGRLYDRQRECTGKLESPHPAVEVVSTDELRNPPDPGDKEAVQRYQAGHTAMRYSEPGLDEQLALI